MSTVLNSTCTPPDIVEVFISQLMIANHSFILTVILISFYSTYFATLKLIRQNVFPACTRILLFSSIINGIIHQGTTAFIRVRALLHAIWYRQNPCHLQFQASDCCVEGIVYYYTNLFSSIVCVSLFLDRLFSFWKTYDSHQKKAAIIYILLQFLIPPPILYWVFYDANYSGYVPMCNYPPPGSSGKFYFVTTYRLNCFYALAIASVALFLVNWRREKKIFHKDYGVDVRYNSYERYLGTKAVCYVLIVQVICLAGTSYIPTSFNQNRDAIGYYWFHIAAAFATGLTYANFFVPIIVYYQTIKIVRSRRVKIQKLKVQPKQDDYFNGLQNVWEVQFEKHNERNN